MSEKGAGNFKDTLPPLLTHSISLNTHLTMTKTAMAEHIRSGRFFSCTFVKQDGTIRKMRARAGVRKHLKGGTLKYNPKDFGYYIVYDLDKREYRCMNLVTIITFNNVPVV